MREMGQLSIRWFRNGDDKAEVFKRILMVKGQVGRASINPLRKFKVDPSILFVLNGCVQTSLTVPKFNYGVALLELNGKAIAHSMFLEYNGHAYICKTSFNNRYKKYGPGIYINYAVVRELISKTDVKVIDFITDLPFSHKWASEVVPVNKFIMARKGTGIGSLYLLSRVLPTSIPKTHTFVRSFDEPLAQLVSYPKTKISHGGH